MPMRPHTDAPHVRNVVVWKSHVIRVSYSARDGVWKRTNRKP